MWSDNTDFVSDEILEAFDRINEDDMIEESYHQGISKVAQIVIDKLKSAGFTILRYDAYSTSSIYLKLDYGVCNSIRISDHEGKKHLAYRYNLISGLSRFRVTAEVYPRYYYPLDMYDFMIDRIIADRNDKVIKYGANNYAKYMEQNRVDHIHDNKGFWSHAELV